MQAAMLSWICIWLALAASLSPYIVAKNASSGANGAWLAAAEGGAAVPPGAPVPAPAVPAGAPVLAVPPLQPARVRTRTAPTAVTAVRDKVEKWVMAVWPSLVGN